MDAAVLIGGCDKTIPAQLMAAGAQDVPSIVNCMEHLHEDGGLMTVLKELKHLLHLDCMTVSGKTLGEEMDARMSGTAFGTIVLHVVPESAVGGPLAVVRDGDMILLDVENRILSLEISAAEMAQRLTEWTPPPTIRDMPGHGYRRLYQERVTQADLGCDFDFMIAQQMTHTAPVI